MPDLDLERLLEVDPGTDEANDFAYPTDNKKMMMMKKKKQKRPKSIVNSESMRVYLSSVIHRLADRVSLATLRPLPVFLGIDNHVFSLSEGAFSPPQDTQKSITESIQTRIALNGTYFLTNYALVAAGVAIVVALLNPGMLLVCGLVYSLWWGHDYLITHNVMLGPYNLGAVLSITQRSTILTILTFFAVLWKCLFPVVSFFLVSALLILLHAVLRDPQHIESGEYPTRTTDDDDGNVIVERGDIL